MNLRLAFVIGALQFGVAQAAIIETKSMQEALATADADTLLIFDLDNTVVSPTQVLGSEEWFDYLVEKKRDVFLKTGNVKEPEATKLAIELALARWNDVISRTTVVAVEAAAPGVIAEKQKLGAKTMGLTARPLNLDRVTANHLKSVGINFQAGKVWDRPLVLPTRAPSAFNEGVVFAGALNKKGDVLVEFLKAIQWTPAKIIFVDNKRHHLENVEAALGATTQYLGVRLGTADAKIAAFDKNIADVEDHYFGAPISDKEAKALFDAGFPKP